MATWICRLESTVNSVSMNKKRNGCQVKLMKLWRNWRNGIGKISEVDTVLQFMISAVALVVASNIMWIPLRTSAFMINRKNLLKMLQSKYQSWSRTQISIYTSIQLFNPQNVLIRLHFQKAKFISYLQIMHSKISDAVSLNQQWRSV